MKNGIEMSKSGRHRIHTNEVGCYILERKEGEIWVRVPMESSYSIKVARERMAAAEMAPCCSDPGLDATSKERS